MILKSGRVFFLFILFLTSVFPHSPSSGFGELMNPGLWDHRVCPSTSLMVYQSSPSAYMFHNHVLGIKSRQSKVPSSKVTTCFCGTEWVQEPTSAIKPMLSHLFLLSVTWTWSLRESLQPGLIRLVHVKQGSWLWNSPLVLPQLLFPDYATSLLWIYLKEHPQEMFWKIDLTLHIGVFLFFFFSSWKSSKFWQLIV